MNGYTVALYVHLLALLAAVGASTVVHTALLKVRTAPGRDAALQWLGLAHGFARVFPVALAALVASGAWLVHSSWSWDAGFVLAGLAGVVLLFVSGAVIEGGRARKLAGELAACPAGVPVAAAVPLARDALLWAASWGNTGIALGVVFAMTAKSSAPAAFAALAIGLAAGCACGLLARGRTAVASDALPSTD
jgi:hypothetical protein